MPAEARQVPEAAALAVRYARDRIRMRGRTDQEARRSTEPTEPQTWNVWRNATNLLLLAGTPKEHTAEGTVLRRDYRLAVPLRDMDGILVLEGVDIRGREVAEDGEIRLYFIETPGTETIGLDERERTEPLFTIGPEENLSSLDMEAVDYFVERAQIEAPRQATMQLWEATSNLLLTHDVPGSARDKGRTPGEFTTRLIPTGTAANTFFRLHGERMETYLHWALQGTIVIEEVTLDLASGAEESVVPRFAISLDRIGNYGLRAFGEEAGTPLTQEQTWQQIHEARNLTRFISDDLNPDLAHTG